MRIAFTAELPSYIECERNTWGGEVSISSMQGIRKIACHG